MTHDAQTPLRGDLALIAEWIRPQARVLDLGCGDGVLLAHLSKHHHTHGYGLEIDPESVAVAVERGVDVIQRDLDVGLADFPDASFDVVLMSQAIQAISRPDQLLQEMVRVGKQAIVTFPNFGHWRVRAGLALGGRMPQSGALPHAWYDSPNRHLCTVRDFEALCSASQIEISRRSMVDSTHAHTGPARWMPNLFGEIAVYQITRATTVS